VGDPQDGKPLEAIDADVVPPGWDNRQDVTGASIQLRKVEVKGHFLLAPEMQNDLAPRAMQY
jgi:hypothetical protein